MKINDIQLTDEHIGRWVTYEAAHGGQECGRIKSWNWKYVFVVFHCPGNWSDYQSYTGCACDPVSLTM